MRGESYFRNGELFNYILEFLRSATLVIPEDPLEHKRLQVEADFYQIEGIVQQLSKEKDMIEVYGITHRFDAEGGIWKSATKVEIIGNQDALDSLPDDIRKDEDETIWRKTEVGDIIVYSNQTGKDAEDREDIEYNVALVIKHHLSKQSGWKCIFSETKPCMVNAGDREVFVIRHDKWQRY